MAEQVNPPAARQAQIRTAGLVLGGILILLVSGYFLFVRMQTVILYEGLSTADAAALVEELEAQGVSYKLAEGGTVIRVARRDADAVRLNLAGTLSPARGLDGFELFNESDMGLTEFAQRIKYQRALQGELARSILMIEGIGRARVHIALPERSMFRAGQSRPTAAVTISLEPGAEDGAILGIQHMVAASVPDLLIEDVVVLDQVGRLLSVSGDVPPAPLAGEAAPVIIAEAGDAIAAPELPAEGAAPGSGGHAGAEAAIRALIADETVTLHVGTDAAAEDGRDPGRHVLIVSDGVLDEALQLAIQDVLAATRPEGEAAGAADRVEFLVRPAAASGLPEGVTPVLMSAVQQPLVQDEVGGGAEISAFLRRYAAEIAGVGGVFLLGALFILVSRKAGRKGEDSRAEFAAHLKAELDKQSGLSRG